MRAGAEIARVQRLAAGVPFILPVVITDAVFAEFPAQVNFLVVHDGGKIEQANIEILDKTACGQNFSRLLFMISARL